MTHLYTLMIGGTVIPGGHEPDVSAIAWAEDTVILLGSDDDVRGISRGDSHVVDLGGAIVVPLGERPDAFWPADATLEIGGRADLAVLESDPRRPDAPNAPNASDGGRLRVVALVRGGRVVAGRLPGAVAPDGRRVTDPAGS